MNRAPLIELCRAFAEAFSNYTYNQGFLLLSDVCLRAAEILEANDQPTRDALMCEHGELKARVAELEHHLEARDLIQEGLKEGTAGVIAAGWELRQRAEKAEAQVAELTAELAKPAKGA